MRLLPSRRSIRRRLRMFERRDNKEREFHAPLQPYPAGGKVWGCAARDAQAQSDPRRVAGDLMLLAMLPSSRLTHESSLLHRNGGFDLLMAFQSRRHLHPRESKPDCSCQSKKKQHTLKHFAHPSPKLRDTAPCSVSPRRRADFAKMMLATRYPSLLISKEADRLKEMSTSFQADATRN